ncbi:MAG: hypothetical protein HY327_13210 [Chloroflexi bacterium]|nr:hypothetical protein [Chloroflexota bacterium]
MKIFLYAITVFILIGCNAAPTAPAPSAATAAIAATPAPTKPSTPFIKDKFSLRDLAGIGRHPLDAAAIGDKIYALNIETENIAVVQNGRAIKFIPVGKQPAALASDAAQKRLYVSSAKDKTISLIVDDQIALTQNIGDAARTLIFSENRLWAGLDSSATILVLDPATLQIQSRITIPNAFSIISLAGDATNHRVYANAFEKTSVIDSSNLRVLNTLATKGSYYTLAANPATDSALVAEYEAATNTQFLISYNPRTGAERSRVKLGGDPRGALLNAGASRLYVAHSFSNDVYVIDPRNLTTLAIIPVGLKPFGLALDENAHRLYVTNYESDSISVINTDTNQIAATIPLAMMPTAWEVNDTTQRAYVANASSDSVFVIEGARVIQEIGVGRHPTDLARDAQSNRLFVANQADGTISIIDENSFAVRATPSITRLLSSVAVDAPRARLFANEVVLDLTTLTPIGRLTLRGVTIGSVITPDFVRVNAAANRVYALGGNGTPGSNSRRVTYSVDAGNLQQRTTLAFSGNIHHIALDVEANRVYGAGTHPLAQTHEFAAWDLNDNKLIALPLSARTTGIAYNPQTQHVFLAHAGTSAAENFAQIFDTTTFGEVGRITLNAPGVMARLGHLIYVSGTDDGAVTIIEDVSVAAPPAPTPTATLTPFATPARTPTR